MPNHTEPLRQHYLTTNATELPQHTPGSFGCHELLDRAQLFADMIDDQLLQHPACLQNPHWFAIAHQAHESLLQLYQAIGAEHLKAQRTHES